MGGRTDRIYHVWPEGFVLIHRDVATHTNFEIEPVTIPLIAMICETQSFLGSLDRKCVLWKLIEDSVIEWASGNVQPATRLLLSHSLFNKLLPYGQWRDHHRQTQSSC